MDIETQIKIINALIYIEEVTLGLGFVGNVLSFVIFSRKAFENNSIGVYMRAMAFTDSFIVVSLIYTLSDNHFKYSMFVESDFACKLFFYVTLGILSMSDWLLATFSVDTMLRVLQTSRFLTLINKRLNQMLIVLVIVVFNLALYSFVPATLNIQTITYNNNYTVKRCDLVFLPNPKLLSYIYVIESSLVPFCIMLTTTVVIVRCLQKSRTKLGQQQNNQARKSKEIRFATSSIVFNVLFVVFKAPITYYYSSTIDNDRESTQMFFLIALVIFYFNYSFRFVFHLIGNSLFRREFLRMLSCSASIADVFITDPTANNNPAIKNY